MLADGSLHRPVDAARRLCPGGRWYQNHQKAQRKAFESFQLKKLLHLKAAHRRVLKLEARASRPRYPVAKQSREQCVPMPDEQATFHLELSEDRNLIGALQSVPWQVGRERARGFYGSQNPTFQADRTYPRIPNRAD